jgi:hypothetical protein
VPHDGRNLTPRDKEDDRWRHPERRASWRQELLPPRGFDVGRIFVEMVRSNIYFFENQRKIYKKSQPKAEHDVISFLHAPSFSLTCHALVNSERQHAMPRLLRRCGSTATQAPTRSTAAAGSQSQLPPPESFEIVPALSRRRPPSFALRTFPRGSPHAQILY